MYYPTHYRCPTEKVYGHGIYSYIHIAFFLEVHNIVIYFTAK